MRKKKCTICKQPKPIKDFNKKKSSPDGYQPHCRECNRKASRKYYHSNREHHKKVTMRRHRKRVVLLQQFTYDYLKEHACVDCGEKDPRCLEFDHLRDKKKNVSNMIQDGASLETLKKEIEKCEVRCANCHRKKTALDQEWYKNINTGQ